MSNRPKIKKMDQILCADEKLRKSIEQMFDFLNDRLDKASPGAHFKPNLDKESEFFIHTPSRKLDLKSINLLGMIMDNLTVMGEQALIKAVERTNALYPTWTSIQEEIPDEQKMAPEEFIVAFEEGLGMQFRLLLDKLMVLPDPEGAVIGYVTSIMLLDYLKPFNSYVSASGQHMKLNMPGESYPIGSPTIFCYVLKYVALKDKEDVKKALAITNFVVAEHPLFPEFRGKPIPFSEN